MYFNDSHHQGTDGGTGLEVKKLISSNWEWAMVELSDSASRWRPGVSPGVCQGSSLEELICSVAQSGPTLCNPMDCGLPVTSVHGSFFFPRQEYWSGLPFPTPRDPPNRGIEPVSSTLQADSLPLRHWESPEELTGSGKNILLKTGRVTGKK